MDILLIDNKTKHFEEIKTLAKSNGASVKIIKCKNIDLINPEDFDFIILSGGSRYSVMGNQKKYVKEIEMIKNTKTPIFGICLGFQLIIKAFEGTLETFNLGNRTQGIIEIKKKKQDDIFKNIQNFKVYESHRWRLKKMPKNFINLAESRDGVEIIKHKKKIIYGVQFHPEVFLNKTCGKQIFDNFMQIVCEKGHPLKREKGRPLRRRERSDQRKRSDLVKRFVFNFQRKNYFNFVKLFFILCFILLPNFVFANNALDIVINEIAWMGTSASSSDEWIELYNNTDEDINLENWSIYGADTNKCLNFADSDDNTTYIISAHNYLIYANHDDDVKDNSGTNIVDIWDASIGMNNTNPGQVILYSASNCAGNAIDIVDCSDNWFFGDNDNGAKRTMERNNFEILENDTENWHTSVVAGGTPKSQNSVIDIEKDEEIELKIEQEIPQEIKKQVVYVSGIIINEILPNSKKKDAENEWIELFNQNDFTVDISGYKISDIEGATKTFVFPENTKISGLGFLVLLRPETKITLNNTGDGVKLFYPNNEIIDQVVFGKAKSNESYSKNGSEWEYTKILTPNAINAFNSARADINNSQKYDNKNADNSPAIAENKNLASINASSEKLSSLNFLEKTNILNSYLTILIAIIISIFSAIIIFFLKKNTDSEF